MKNIDEKIKEIIHAYTDVKKEDIKPESDLITDLKLDSLGIANLVIEFEDEFNIVIEEDTMFSLKKVSDIIEYVNANVD